MRKFREHKSQPLNDRQFVGSTAVTQQAIDQITERMLHYRASCQCRHHIAQQLRIKTVPQRNSNTAADFDTDYQTYVERDVRLLINLKDVSLFENFIKLLAGRVGQVLNIASLAGDVGVNAKTISHWLSILKASFIIFKLPPYFESFGKRVIKSPIPRWCITGRAET